MNTNNSAERLYYIDWIRVMAFLLLIFFHSALPFTKFPWEVKNAAQSDALSSVIWWLHQWRLPLLFFISGAGIHFSLKRRSLPAFMIERTLRLFVPLLFAMFFTIPLQVYVEFLQKGKISGTYLDFYPSVWNLVLYPDGSLTWSHMWFIAYLIALIILLFPVWLLSKSRMGVAVKTMLSDFLANPIVTSLLALPLTAIFNQLYLDYPETGGLVGDWFVLSFSATLILYGFFLGGNPSFWNSCMRYRKLYGIIALASTISLFSLYWWPMRLPETPGPRSLVYAVLNVTAIWQTILFICGTSRKYLYHESPLLAYLNQAVFPFFIIHQTVIVAIGYLVVNMQFAIPVKLTLLTTLSTVAIFSLYHFIIKRTKVTRFLFGMKQKPNH